ncbi:MAG: ribosomal protein L7/L12 [Muribaculaceae bacterium]|nr:ribosomal protein L7/L12 [Muribaculaceae bacterium]
MRRGLSKAEAEIIATTLKKAGAVVEIKKTLPGNSVSASQKTSFTVILKSAGHAKLGVVKCVKELTGLGLKDSKELVDNAPSTIRRGLSKAEAEIIATTLKKAGAEVIII